MTTETDIFGFPFDSNFAKGDIVRIWSFQSGERDEATGSFRVCKIATVHDNGFTVMALSGMSRGVSERVAGLSQYFVPANGTKSHSGPRFPNNRIERI
jgi:TRAP-type mannitol/chloroaromatic compound transport system permease small subunit